jgi:hypothetical protein
MEAASAGDALDGEPQDVKDRVLADLKLLFAEHEGPGGVRMPAMAWLVSARA